MKIKGITKRLEAIDFKKATSIKVDKKVAKTRNYIDNVSIYDVDVDGNRLEFLHVIRELPAKNEESFYLTRVNGNSKMTPIASEEIKENLRDAAKDFVENA